MPYKDPEKQKEAKRKYYRRKYAEDPDFVEAERQRKLAHYAANREERLPQMRAYSQEWYAKVEKKRRKAVVTPVKKASANGRRPIAKKTAAKVARKLVAKTVRKPKARALLRRAPARNLKRPVAKTAARVARSRPRAAVPPKKARPRPIAKRRR